MLLKNWIFVCCSHNVIIWLQTMRHLFDNASFHFWHLPFIIIIDRVRASKFLFLCFTNKESPTDRKFNKMLKWTIPLNPNRTVSQPLTKSPSHSGEMLWPTLPVYSITERVHFTTPSYTHSHTHPDCILYLVRNQENQILKVSGRPCGPFN